MVYDVYIMERNQIYLEKEQKDQLKRVANERGVSMSSVIREAVAKYLAAAPEPPLFERVEDHPIWKIIGIVGKEDGPDVPRDGSTTYKRDLYGGPRP
jgi:hypothetical protein